MDTGSSVMVIFAEKLSLALQNFGSKESLAQTLERKSDFGRCIASISIETNVQYIINLL